MDFYPPMKQRKKWHRYRTKYYEATNERETVLCDNANIMLSEISQAQKVTATSCQSLSVICGI